MLRCVVLCCVVLCGGRQGGGRRRVPVKAISISQWQGEHGIEVCVPNSSSLDSDQQMITVCHDSADQLTQNLCQ